MKANGSANGRHPRNGNGTVAAGARAAIYCRLSVERPDQELSSLEVQRSRCESYASSQGWTVLRDRYDDDGFSGATTQRPGLTRLLADIEAGHIDVLVTVRIDRLSRSMLDFLRIMEHLDRYSVALVSITQEVNTATAWGRMVLNILAGFGQFEREMISERTRDKIHAARKKGRWTGGTPILGYDVAPEGGKLVVNETEAKRVRRIFELYLEKGSIKETLREMNCLGITRKRWKRRDGVETGGRRFNRSGLHILLTNPIFVGRVKLDDETHEGEHPTIVDTAVWDEVQRRLQANGFKKAAAFRNEHGAFLKGLLHCSACDARMTHSVSRKGDKVYRYYICGRAMREGWSNCPTRSVAAGIIEAAVLDEMRGTIQDQRIERDVWAEVVKLRRERIRQLERDIAILPEDADPKTFQRLQEELAALNESQIDRDDVATAVTEFTSLWDALTYQEHEQLSTLLVERIDYDGTAIEIRFLDAAHVE